jgi:hypothetical protein
MYQNSDYLKAISDKLERLNVASHGTPEPVKAKGDFKKDPDSIDPLQWMGQAALDFLNKKNINEIQINS